MKRFTQTNLDPGNCWQTCVACLLNVEPSELPPQEVYDWWKLKDDGTRELGPGYSNKLNAYLFKHHGLIYAELFENQFPSVMPREPGWHVMVGSTVRTEANGGRKHVVVAQYGRVVWDPHPSHDGLITVERWGLLVPMPKNWVETWNKIPCVCPACGGDPNPPTPP